MTLDEETGEFVLSTGRRFYLSGAGHAWLLSPDLDGQVAGGYDDRTHFDSKEADAEDFERVLTPEERREIADAMIAIWNAWAKTGEPTRGL